MTDANEQLKACFDFVITGIKPIPKQRPRFSQGRAFTPAATRNFEEMLAWRFRQVAKTPLRGAVRAVVRFETRSRADVDNLAKAVLDAGNRILYTDDSQIATLTVSKVKADREIIRIFLEEIS